MSTTTNGAGSPRYVRCPICADRYPWPNDAAIWIYNEETGGYEKVDLVGRDPVKGADLVRRGYRQCPNPSKDAADHYLPAGYASYQDPLVIGLVGAPVSGKTHLLTAMIRQAYRGGLTPYDLTTASLDFRRHKAFRTQFIERLERGEALPATGTGEVEAADILLLRDGKGNERPVTFFDVSGEDLESTDARNISTRFLISADAVIFVHAPADPIADEPVDSSENRSFELAVERLQGRLSGSDDLPCVIAVTKSDRLRYVHPADRWLRRGDERVVNADRIRAESRDTYSYLHRVGAQQSLRPFDALPRCTLHFVSASGGDAVRRDGADTDHSKYFPRGIRPTRVLEPLVAILAMTGVIAGAEAQKVGTW